MDYMKYITIQVIKKSERSEVVFAAMDEMDVPVVVKRLQGANPEIYRGISNIRNPHIPRIYCMEEQGDELCVAEEYIDGRTLDVYLAQEVLTNVQKLSLAIQLCEAVGVLHRCIPPVIHRDIKPSNILVTGDDVLKLIDFDASRQYKREKDTGDTRLLGTVEYAAPEQFGYAQTDVRSDIYSMGVVLNEMNIGKDALFVREWKRLVDKCTSFDPDNRYKDVQELKRDLEKCMRKGTSRGRKKWVVPVAAAAILLVMLPAGWIQMQRDRSEYTEEGANPTATSVAEADVTETVNGITPVATNDVADKTVEETTALRKFVTKPEEVTEWYIPPIRKGYIDDDGTYKIGKRIVGDVTEKVGYACGKLNRKDSRDVSWEINEDADIIMNFDKAYGQLVLELPEVFDMKYCNRLVVWAENKIGDIAIVLYNEDFEELEQLYLNQTEWVGEYSFYPKTEETVEYVGFMAVDGGTEDGSGFESVIKYVDFYMVNQEGSKLSYDMADLKVENYYFLNSIRWDEVAEGAVTLNYNRVYGEIRLVLPEPVDMGQCTGVSVVMDTGGEAFTVKLFDEEFKELDYSYDHITNGMEEVMLDVWVTENVHGIGLMLDEAWEGNGTDYRNSVVTVQSIRFYMKPGYEKEF